MNEEQKARYTELKEKQEQRAADRAEAARRKTELALAEKARVEREHWEIKRLERSAEEFHWEYTDYYKGKDVRDKVTQPMWYSMFLSKKRLEKQGLELDIQVGEWETEKHREDYDATVTVETRKRDDAYLLSRSVGTAVRKKILKQGEAIYAREYSRLMVASAVSNRMEDVRITCPNCGRTDEIFRFVDGCDYCGTKFEIRQDHNRVSGFSLLYTDKESLRKFKAGIKAFLLVVLTAFACGAVFQFFSLHAAGGTAWPHTLASLASFLLKSGLIGLVLAAVSVQVMELKRKRRLERSEALDEYCARHPDFIADNFATLVESRLKAVHFAENAEEIAAFFEMDTNALLPKYASVAECSMDQLFVARAERTEGGDRLELDADMTLLRLVPGRGGRERIREEQETVHLTLEQDADQVAHGPVYDAYACPNCGYPVSLLEGGVCSACGTKLSMRKYDWVITGYRAKRYRRKNIVPKLILASLCAALLLEVLGL